MTTEHGTLFNGPMVRATLDGRKNETRRLITPRNSLVDGIGIGSRGYLGEPDFWQRLQWSDAWVDPGPSPAGNPGPYLKVPHPGGSVHRIYPRVQVGDLLYGRETWGVFDRGSVEPFEAGEEWTMPFPLDYALAYKATDEDPGVPATWVEAPTGHRVLAADDRWRPSIHMPRWAARIWLRVEDGRVERLQEIDEAGAISEGATSRTNKGRRGAQTLWNMDWSRIGTPGTRGVIGTRDIGLFTARMAFANAWNRIHGTDAWGRNDWVWVVRFSRTEASHD